MCGQRPWSWTRPWGRRGGGRDPEGPRTSLRRQGADEEPRQTRPPLGRKQREPQGPQPPRRPRLERARQRQGRSWLARRRLNPLSPDRGRWRGASGAPPDLSYVGVYRVFRRAPDRRRRTRGVLGPVSCFQIGTTRLTSSIAHAQAENASARWTAAQAIATESLPTETRPTRCTIDIAITPNFAFATSTRSARVRIAMGL